MEHSLSRQWVQAFLMSTILMTGLTGCGVGDVAHPQVNNQTDVHRGNGGVTYNTYQKIKPHIFSEHQRIASGVADTAEDLPGVTRATAIIYQNQLIVGIDILDRSNSRMLEQKVYQMVKDKEPQYEVSVSSNMNIHNQIQEVYNNRRGNPNHLTRIPPMADIDLQISRIIRNIHGGPTYSP